MSLNIKNQGTVALVRELAQRTGESQTSAIERAVAERLDRLTAEAAMSNGEAVERRDATTQLLFELHRSVTDAERAAVQEAVVSLYDETGLPR